MRYFIDLNFYLPSGQFKFMYTYNNIYIYTIYYIYILNTYLYINIYLCYGVQRNLITVAFKPRGFKIYLMHDDPVLIGSRFHYFIYLSEKL